MKKTVAFIFARGGSKGLPDKNKLDLFGHPLIAYSIFIAKNNPMIDDVYVSTDSKDIAKIALDYGANVIKRPKILALDNSPEFLSWKHAVQYVSDKFGDFDRFISLPPTSPLRSLKDIEECLKNFDKYIDTIITITPSNRSPWFNMVSKNDEGRVSVLMKGKEISRRQESPEVFDITTVAYVSRPLFILNSSSIWDGRVKGIIIPKIRALDIDDHIDFLIASHLIKERKDLLPVKVI